MLPSPPGKVSSSASSRVAFAMCKVVRRPNVAVVEVWVGATIHDFSCLRDPVAADVVAAVAQGCGQGQGSETQDGAESGRGAPGWPDIAHPKHLLTPNPIMHPMQQEQHADQLAHDRFHAMILHRTALTQGQVRQVWERNREQKQGSTVRPDESYSFKRCVRKIGRAMDVAVACDTGRNGEECTQRSTSTSILCK
eukprot:scaffold396_cov339-Prasinococcus_capsulatus_cf.AAC.19